MSPAQLLFIRRLSDALPVLSNKLLPHVRDAKEQLIQRQQRTTEVHDQFHSTQHRALTLGTYKVSNGQWMEDKSEWSG